MRFGNETDLAAELLRGASASGEDKMLGCVIARATFRWRDGALEPTPDEPWPVGEAPAATPLGMMPGDKGVYLGGVDVLLGGRVHAPKPTPRLDLELEVGRTFRRRIAVFGDRVWEPGVDGKLVPSAPKPFRSMPLAQERAFGGEVLTPYGILMPFAANPRGTGFYLTAESALGEPLPNLEDPAALVKSPDERPNSVGLGYYDGALRGPAAIDQPVATAFMNGTLTPELAATLPFEPLRPEQVKPTLFNQAHPAMVIEAHKAPRPGDRVRLSHGLPDGDLAFLLPALVLHLHVQLETREHLLPMHLDQIGIVAGEGRLMLSFRCVFEYRLVKRERRFVTLHRGPLPQAVPATYRAALPADPWCDENA